MGCWLLAAAEELFDVAIVSREPEWCLRPMGANRLQCQASLPGHGRALNEDGCSVVEMLHQLVLNVARNELGDIAIRTVYPQ